MDGGQVSRSWCAGVVGHSYGGLGGDRDVGGGLEACGTKPGRIGSMLGDVGALPECEVKTQIALNQTTFQVRSSG